MAEQLEIPLRERNALLLAAGYAPVYAERPLEATEMAPVRQAIDRFLRAHEPYPAVVVDRHHNLIASNDALELLLEGVDPELLHPPANGMRVALHPRGDGAASSPLKPSTQPTHTLPCGRYATSALSRPRR